MAAADFSAGYLALDAQALAEAFGGLPALRRHLARNFSVVERPQPGRPRGMAPPRRALSFRAAPPGAVHLPRRAAAALFAGGRARPPPPPPGAAPPRRPPMACAPPTPLYGYQAAAAAFIAAALAEGEAGPARGGDFYLEMGAGLGKTRVALAVAAARGGAALVVAPTRAIADQWVDEARAWGMRAALFANALARPPGPATHDLVAVVVNTAREKPGAFAAGYSLVVLDEAHELCSKENSRALWLAQAAPAALGLSASPHERGDGLDRLVPLFLGPPRPAADIPGFDAAPAAFRGAVRLLEFAGHPDHARTLVSAAGTVSAPLTLGALAADPFRLRLVAEEVGRLLRLHEGAGAAALGLGPPPGAPPGAPPRRHGVFVFAEHREYLPALRAALLACPAAAAAGLLVLDGADAAAASDAASDGASDGAASDDAAGDDAASDDAASDDAGDDAGVGAGDGDSAEAAGDSAEAAGGDAIPAGGASPAGVAAAPGSAAAGAPPVSILRGGAHREAVNDARRAGAHVVLTTYGFSRRGISLPEMTAIVLATPRRTGSTQILGRITRRGSDESIVRQVVDIVDVCTGLKGQAATRRKAYAAKGWPVTRAKASWEDFRAGLSPVESGSSADE